VELSASPLRSPEGTLFGVLYVFRETSERERLQQSLLRELDELARVQRKVLPSRDAAIPGLRYDWLFLPTAFGGGDALGCVRLDDGHVGFYALDVIGQGIFSALFSLLLHTFLSPHADRGGILTQTTCDEQHRRVLSPVEVVRELNKRFFLRDESNPYFTMSYGVLEPGTGSVRLVRAGHPFPLLQRATGEIEMVQPEGYAVGLFPSSDVAMEELQLRAGDRLFLYSDGLVDATNAVGVRFSSSRLAELVTASAGRPLSELVASISAGLVAWRGSESFADDVSLLVLEKD